jgi:hypothetical protein
MKSTYFNIAHCIGNVPSLPIQKQPVAIQETLAKSLGRLYVVHHCPEVLVLCILNMKEAIPHVYTSSLVMSSLTGSLLINGLLNSGSNPKQTFFNIPF